MHKPLFLIGMMGCGKSTLGRKLAAQIGCPFVDLDEEIVRAEGRSIPDIFAEVGDAGFRAAETAALRRVIPSQPCVVATGGGIVTREENIALMRQAGWVIWLCRPLEDMIADVRQDTRPNLAGDKEERMRTLYAQREALYARAAHIDYDNRKPPAQAAQGLYELLLSRQSNALRDEETHPSTTLEKLHTGELYLPMDDSIIIEQRQCMERLYDFNTTRPSELQKRGALLREMFAEFGEGSYVEPPLHANFGGKHVHLGRNVYVNFSLTLVDDTHIFIGDDTMIGPNVTISSAGHPILPELRRKGYQYNMPVHIGHCCWIGAGVIILPGVTIGDESVIGAGSVVTRDIPAHVVAVGNPCRVMREIGERDRAVYFKNRPIDEALLK